MSHDAQRDFIKIISENMKEYFHDSRVLEIGSLDINGTVRDFFTNCDYIGLDVAEGKHVDVVCEGQNYTAPDNSFDHVISCEAMEHNPYWVETFENMIRVCKPGGLIVMTCASTGRAEHGTSRTRSSDSPLTTELGWDYYLNLKESDFRNKVKFQDTFSKSCFWVNWTSYDLYFIGIKKNKCFLPENEVKWGLVSNAITEYVESANKLKICRYRAFFARFFGDKWFSMMRALEDSLAYIHGR